jgi:hypothetical protein
MNYMKFVVTELVFLGSLSTDMSSLLLETVHASTHIPFAKALISEITKLTASHPVNV